MHFHPVVQKNLNTISIFHRFYSRISGGKKKKKFLGKNDLLVLKKWHNKGRRIAFVFLLQKRKKEKGGKTASTNVNFENKLRSRSP